MQLTITHLYPEKMNLYGDLGNIITLTQRARIRGIDIEVRNLTIEDKLKTGSTDIYFFGGGQDQEQVEIGEDILKKKTALLADLNDGVPMLSICGGYQLLGKYFLTGDNQKAAGVGLFPIETVAPSTEVKQRCIGNIAVKIVQEQTLKEISKYYTYPVDDELLKTLVGFENHSGRTRLLTIKNMHLGKVIKGIGDSEIQGFEGIRYKNAFGTYMHGSFLPKNPHIADLLLSLALKRKYSKTFKLLEPLDDKLEWEAHQYALSLS